MITQSYEAHATAKQPKRFAKCILHIGTEKTGTKVIQNFLRSNRKRFLRAGIFYPHAAKTEQASQWEFVAAVHDSPWEQDVGRSFGIASSEDQAAFQNHLRKILAEEFQTVPSAHTLLISSEHFQSRLHTPNKIQALKNFLMTWADSFEVIVYFRRQDQLALSFLSTRLKSSVNLSYASLIRAMRSTPRYYDYLKIYQNWAEVFGADAVTARLYQPDQWLGGTIVHDFCRVLKLPEPLEPIPMLNTSLNRKGFQFLQSLNARLPITPGDTSDTERRALVQYISEAYSGKFYPISRQEALTFYAKYKDGNEDLRQLAFPDYPSPLFSEDFSEYPDDPDCIEPEYGDAVEMALDLWRNKPNEKTAKVDLKGKVRSWLKGGKA